MARPTTRRSPRLETLEARKLLSADVTGEQQLMLELINEALINPESAAERVEQGLTRGAITAITRDGDSVESVISDIASSDSRPPVAWDASLADAAKRHTEYQIRLGGQTHDGPKGLETATDRVIAAGYGNPDTVAENIIYGVDSSEHAMRAFLADYGPGNSQDPHRENILQTSSDRNESHQDVGVAILPVEVSVDRSTPFGSPTPSTETKLVVTQVFARKEEAAPKILGVVFDDSNNDQFYDLGEGVSNAEVTITNSGTGQSSRVTTWSSGGYQAEVTPGVHQVEVRVNDRLVGRRDVVVGRENTKIDFRVNDAPRTVLQMPVSSTPRSTATSTVRPSVAPVAQRTVTFTPASTPAPAPAPTPAPSSAPTPTQIPSRSQFTSPNVATRTRASEQAPAAPPTLSPASLDPTPSNVNVISASRVDARPVARETRTFTNARPNPPEPTENSSALTLLKSSLSGGSVRSWRIAEGSASDSTLSASSR
ncbi:CAP domain-containing protein [Tautonia marina]|uniref:CAP domain-containing protein n=1 Tax=Tautonia marina TaxID=2653855 RepID=UPI001375AC0A|nr:carboxypeptidase regulatory-like domain-containing protein [Tautonia marina]